MTSGHSDKTEQRQLIALIAASTIGVAFVLWLAATRPRPVMPVRRPARIVETADRPGIAVRLTAAGITVERTLATPAFDLGPEESLDWRVPPGPFTADMTVRMLPGSGGLADIGASIRGGQLTVRMHGEPIVIEYAGDEPRDVFGTQPVYLPLAGAELSYEFVADADERSSMRAIWRPLGSPVPRPLPVRSPRLLGDGLVAGAAHVQQQHCVRCHQSERRNLQLMLRKAVPPLLERIGAFAAPAWMRAWLDAPVGMPDVLPRGPDRDLIIEDLVHFLAARGGPVLAARDASGDPGLVETGRRLFADVGCLACHGPLEGPPRPGVALDRTASKWPVPVLAEYLGDPLVLHPDGRMPDMSLTDDEAAALAAYLIETDRAGNGLLPDAPFALDQARVDRGAEHFTVYGCANCHPVEGLRATFPAPRLEDLSGAGASGCLDPAGDERAPRYVLSSRARSTIGAFLDALEQIETLEAPHDRVAMDVQRLRCTACHGFHGEPGPSRHARAAFRTLGEADLGDEGRVPPDLAHVGSRLRPAWLQRVLDEGARARPYLATRMPRFGTGNVAGLGAALAALDGAGAVGDAEPEFSAAAADAGRTLVGAGGLNCIECHRIAGREATGTPGTDLVTAVARLGYPAFAAWVHDPALMRPGTRMPSFFVGGRSGLTDVLGGDAEGQVAAMWSYLTQGELLPLPEGLVDPSGIDVEVVGRPTVFRTFMSGAGGRAIACGYPAQVHCAYDADACDLAIAWTGSFLDARGAWAGRGGTETNPESIVWRRAAPTFQDEAGNALPARFAGYELDPDGVPTMRYTLTVGDGTVEVGDRTAPRGTKETLRLVRRIELRGAAGTRLVMGLPAAALQSGGGRLEAVDAARTRLILDAEGRASVATEITW